MSFLEKIESGYFLNSSNIFMRNRYEQRQNMKFFERNYCRNTENSILLYFYKISQPFSFLCEIYEKKFAKIRWKISISEWVSDIDVLRNNIVMK